MKMLAPKNTLDTEDWKEIYYCVIAKMCSPTVALGSPRYRHLNSILKKLGHNGSKMIWIAR